MLQNYTGEEIVDLKSLEDAFHPIILTSEVHGDEVTLTMTYMARLISTPFWEFKFDGGILPYIYVHMQL